VFRIITSWNFVQPEKDLEKAVSNIKLRGYADKETFLTGQFAAKVANKEIRSLSVGDIADFLCPSRRDLYFKKGKNRMKTKSQKTWGGVAGRLVENFTLKVFSECQQSKNPWSYSKIKQRTGHLSRDFKKENFHDFDSLNKLKSRPGEEPDWLLKSLTYSGRAELGLKLLHMALTDSEKKISAMQMKDLEISTEKLKPHPEQIGISQPAKPDFLVEKCKIVGDIKSAIGGFKDYYFLTCAGYALAYENCKGRGNDIDFGIIYFFPTRYTEYAKPISFGQVYLFPIDDGLRDWFLKTRNKAYDIISKDSPPDFPYEKGGNHCPFCHFRDTCVSQGLVL